MQSSCQEVKQSCFQEVIPSNLPTFPSPLPPFTISHFRNFTPSPSLCHPVAKSLLHPFSSSHLRFHSNLQTFTRSHYLVFVISPSLPPSFTLLTMFTSLTAFTNSRSVFVHCTRKVYQHKFNDGAPFGIRLHFATVIQNFPQVGRR